jgi:hypothetical protein
MTFKTHNDKRIESSGSGLIGEIDASYEELCNLFGAPSGGDGYKTDAYWGIEFDDGVIATVYNYKDGKNYEGENGLAVEEIRDWHVGGFKDKALVAVQIALDLHREQTEANRKKDPIETAMQSAIEIMDMLKATKGENYMRLVEIGLLVRKNQDLLHAMVGAAIAGGEVPELAGTMLGQVNAQISAKILGIASRMGGVMHNSPKGTDAEELMSWVDRVLEAESKGAKSLIESLREGQDK